MKNASLEKVFLSLFLIIVYSLVGAISSMTQAYAALPTSMEATDYALSGDIENGVRVVKVTASKYKFEPDPIVVNFGEKVRIDLTSVDVAHGFAVSAFKFNLHASAKKTKSAEFMADKRGSFKIGCSVFCGFGHGHMQAKLIVR